MTEPVLLTDLDQGVLTLTLNRPERLNSFNPDLHAALMAQLQRAEAAAVDPEKGEPIRALLLTGAGRGFCAGQDLTDRVRPPEGDAPPPDLGATIEALYNPLIRRLYRLPLPVICAVNGAAAGAGANLALACDIVLAAQSAKFLQAFARIGLVPDSGGTWILPRLVGRARAMGLALLAEPLSAAQAADWGLIWRAVPDDQLMTEARCIAQTLAAGPTRGYALIKQALLASQQNDLDAQLVLERDLQRQAGFTHDYAEGVRAFLGKRAPAFRGH